MELRTRFLFDRVYFKTMLGVMRGRYMVAARAESRADLLIAGFKFDAIEAETKRRIREAFQRQPRLGQIWRHHSGRLYRVDSIRNTTHPSEKFPLTICCTNIANGSEWSRRLDDWHRSFTFEADTP